jgi:hypothetical protein
VNLLFWVLKEAQGRYILNKDGVDERVYWEKVSRDI